MNNDEGDSCSFYAMLRVILPVSLRVSGATSDASRGYYINIGLNATDPQAAIDILEALIQDGEIDWSDSVWTQGAQIDPTLALRSVGVACGEVWYKSGRILFP